MTRVASPLLILLLTAATARADVAPPYPYDGRTRLVLGLTVSGHVLVSAGAWRTLTLPVFSPDLRWGLRDSGGVNVELPIAWMARKHKPLPLGLQTRWWPETH